MQKPTLNIYTKSIYKQLDINHCFILRLITGTCEIRVVADKTSVQRLSIMFVTHLLVFDRAKVGIILKKIPIFRCNLHFFYLCD
jgi:hypothetical protein